MSDEIDVLQKNFEAIGKVTTAWSSFEFSLNMVIWSLAGINQQQGQCLTAQIPNLQGRVRALLSLFRLVGGNEDTARKVNKFFSTQVEPVSRIRNRIVHDPIARNDAGHVVRLEITADKTLSSKLADDPITEANTAFEKITQLTQQFQALRNEMFNSLPPSVRLSSAPSLQTST